MNNRSLAVMFVLLFAETAVFGQGKCDKFVARMEHLAGELNSKLVNDANLPERHFYIDTIEQGGKRTGYQISFSDRWDTYGVGFLPFYQDDSIDKFKINVEGTGQFLRVQYEREGEFCRYTIEPVQNRFKLTYRPDDGWRTGPAMEPGKAAPPPPNGIYSQAGQMPVPGYDVDAYFKKNLRDPRKENQASWSARMEVVFVVAEDGSVAEPVSVVSKSVSMYGGHEEGHEGVEELAAAFEKEMIRLVKAMPKWTPGSNNGKAVKVYQMKSVKFDPKGY